MAQWTRDSAMVVRLCAMAFAAAALAGCASYSGYDSYPDETYYGRPYGPYYGGAFGSYYDDDFDRHYHHPPPNVSCDRRTKECSVPSDGLRRLEPGNPGSVGSAPRFDDDDAPVRRVAPARQTNDEAAPQRVKPRREATPRMADNDNDVVRPTRRVQSEQPHALPRMNSNDKVRGGGAGNACPPQGCRD
jgi:hypothetical protein